MISHALAICHVHQKLVLTGFYLFKLATAIKVDMIAKCQMPSGNVTGSNFDYFCIGKTRG